MAERNHRDNRHENDPAGGTDAARAAETDEARAPETDEEDGTAIDSELGALRAEVEDLNGKWLRALADLDNYRKRVERDRGRWSESAREAIILDLLDVVDNFERALACDDSEADSGNGSLREGVELILKHLVDVLAKHGVTPIVTDGCEFDPNLHEAVGHVETDACDPDHVVEETQKGYKLGERLLRCSKVIVAK
jgi:molecular chaperone GrpE